MIQVVDDRPVPDEAPAGNRLVGEAAPPQPQREEETAPPVDFFPMQAPPISWPRILPGL